MSNLRGNIDRVIETPGYHLKPQYDLEGTRARLYDGQKKNTNAVLPLASMIDMFSVLVIFLILNFSATGEVFFVNKDIKLPEAKNTNPLQGFPVVSVAKDIVSLDAERVGENPLSIEEKDYNLPMLKASLQRIRSIEETIYPGREFQGRINLQADQDLAVVYIKRVMNTLIETGWVNINFAVQPIQEN
ncbi:MAG: biopolymer transporter ExbD [Bdellovibrionota bacterium]|nr:biopolymer transporter ExbD [Bdellovibrionota bacterium]